MCTLAIYFQAHRRYPLVIAANRDELLDRPALPPQVVWRDPWIVSGIDQIAGGTWLGLNQHHLVVSVLNRRTDEPGDASRRSRGALCSELLHAATVADALAAARADRRAYNPFNLLLASPQAAYVLSNLSEPWSVAKLDPGVHLISNLSLNDPTCPRIAKSHRLFERIVPGLDGDLESFRGAAREILSDHSTPLDPRGEGPPTNLCSHLGRYGTRCSSLLIYDGTEQRTEFWHADGPPCTSAYRQLALPRAEPPDGLSS
ncbi:MAG TPA: NRDE family protein [Terriglobales bacterium]|nr:NRDE family protein [Terriglobales bacterium]